MSFHSKELSQDLEKQPECCQSAAPSSEAATGGPVLLGPKGTAEMRVVPGAVGTSLCCHLHPQPVLHLPPVTGHGEGGRGAPSVWEDQCLVITVSNI